MVRYDHGGPGVHDTSGGAGLTSPGPPTAFTHTLCTRTRTAAGGRGETGDAGHGDRPASPVALARASRNTVGTVTHPSAVRGTPAEFQDARDAHRRQPIRLTPGDTPMAANLRRVVPTREIRPSSLGVPRPSATITAQTRRRAPLAGRPVIRPHPEVHATR